MADKYDKKRRLLDEAGPKPDAPLLEQFWERVCSAPFKPKPGPGLLWLSLWDELSSSGRSDLCELPDPCLNHLEDRMRNPKRARKLKPGARRLVGNDESLFLEGARLCPHALCRAAEALGAAPEKMWDEIEKRLAEHRLWQLPASLDADNFWSTAQQLAPYRELPQAVLDYLEAGRSRESAPLEDFLTSTHRFLVRARLEKIRFTTYAALGGRSSEREVAAGPNR